MKEREIQFLVNLDISCHNMIELRDGKLLFYYTTRLSNIYIYNEKTFQKIYEINMHKIIYLFKKEKLIDNYKNEYFNIEDEKNDNIEYYLTKYTKSKNCIKELDNNLILIGINKYLIEIKLLRKYYNYKIIKKFDNITVNSIEISYYNNQLIKLNRGNVLLFY